MILDDLYTEKENKNINKMLVEYLLENNYNQAAEIAKNKNKDENQSESIIIDFLIKKNYKLLEETLSDLELNEIIKEEIRRILKVKIFLDLISSNSNKKEGMNYLRNELTPLFQEKKKQRSENENEKYKSNSNTTNKITYTNKDDALNDFSFNYESIACNTRSATARRLLTNNTNIILPSREETSTLNRKKENSLSKKSNSKTKKTKLEEKQSEEEVIINEIKKTDYILSKEKINSPTLLSLFSSILFHPNPTSLVKSHFILNKISDGGFIIEEIKKLLEVNYIIHLKQFKQSNLNVKSQVKKAFNEYFEKGKLENIVVNFNNFNKETNDLNFLKKNCNSSFYDVDYSINNYSNSSNYYTKTSFSNSQTIKKYDDEIWILEFS